MRSIGNPVSTICIGALFFLFDDEGLSTKLQVLVPMIERRTILSHYHDNRTSAHLGLRKTLAKIRQEYYWPGLQNDVKLYVAGCLQ
jgi:hypothetical protein